MRMVEEPTGDGEVRDTIICGDALEVRQFLFDKNKEERWSA